MAATLAGVYDYVSGFMMDIIVAVIILLIGFIIGRLLGQLTKKVLHELEIDRILKAGKRRSIEKGAGKFVACFIYFIAVIAALNQVGITTTVLHMVVAAALFILVISVALGVKDFIPNFFAGIQIQRNEMIRAGDRIRVAGTEGKVSSVDLTRTKLKTSGGDIIFIPNSTLVKEKVVRKK